MKTITMETLEAGTSAAEELRAIRQAIAELNTDKAELKAVNAEIKEVKSQYPCFARAGELRKSIKANREFLGLK